VHCIV